MNKQRIVTVQELWNLHAALRDASDRIDSVAHQLQLVRNSVHDVMVAVANAIDETEPVSK